MFELGMEDILSPKFYYLNVRSKVTKFRKPNYENIESKWPKNLFHNDA